MFFPRVFSFRTMFAKYERSVLRECYLFKTNLPAILCDMFRTMYKIKKWKVGRMVVVVALLFYVHGKHLRSCRDGQLT